MKIVKYLFKEVLLVILLLIAFGCHNDRCQKDDVLSNLVERNLPGKSSLFVFEKVKSDGKIDFFELESKGSKVVIRGNNRVSLATGFNWYLKYFCHANISWGGNNIDVSGELPIIKEMVRKETDQVNRYYLNYCTYGYSMPWWSWERWEREIDWMALHGVNMPLLIVGEEAVWQNTLKHLDYTEDEIGKFLTGPAFLPWFYMNNLEAWGGPMPQSWIDQQVELRLKIQNRMEELEMEPVFHGFSGMVPSSFKDKFPELNIHDPGTWCGFQRPAFLVPTDSTFKKTARIYYDKQKELFGTAKYYAADPFHEGGNTKGVDLKVAGSNILGEMQRASNNSKWLIQAWQGNPKKEMIEHLDVGDVVVLDLWAETDPHWGDSVSRVTRKGGFGKHNFIWCNLNNFGGNVGMHGKIEEVILRWEQSKTNPLALTRNGVGITTEGIENNPIIYELLYELPWHEDVVVAKDWVKEYARSRYGKSILPIEKAWLILYETAYKCNTNQQGVTESVFCARPSFNTQSVSTWGTAELYYNPDEFEEAWPLFLEESDQLKHLDTYKYDLVDYTRQVLANRGNLLLKRISKAYSEKDIFTFNVLTKQFLELILDQDRLLGTNSGFMLGVWLESAKDKGYSLSEKQLYEWNARTIITTWGDRYSSNNGGLHEYSHREWNGLLKDFYYPRWKMFFDTKAKGLMGEKIEPIDYFSWEEKWTKKKNIFATTPQNDPVVIAKELFNKYYGSQ